MLRLTLINRFLTGAFAIFVAIGCSEDGAGPSKRPFLIGKTWIVTASLLDGEDVTDEREECETDNTTVFFSDGTFIDDMGSLVCDEFESDAEGTWVLKSNETILSFQLSGQTASDWKIDALTEDRLEISQYVPAFKARVGVVMEPLSR